MKIFNADETGDLHPLGRGRFNWLYKHLILLKVGEAIAIRFTDWNTKAPPYKTIRTAAKNVNRQFDYGRNPDGSGWLVKRVG